MLLVNSVLLIAAFPMKYVIADIDDSFYEWQTDRLLAPSDTDVQMENDGHIFIYSNLTDIDVEHALDDQFDRIESMMFVNTIVTDNTGTIQKDPLTGEMPTEDDC